MQVILKADVKGKGKKDQLVKVSDGYARNYLFPRNLAVEANAENMSVMQSKNDSVAFRKQEELNEANALKEVLDKTKIELTAKAGENGRLFGSITSKEIGEALLKQFHIKIDKKKINLPEGIKALGIVKVPVKLHPGIVATLTVSVTEQK